MFEIRVICQPTDTDRVLAALDGAFTTGSVRHYPTRDGQRHRLYATVDHRTAPGPWPTPEQAYKLAPSIISEIGWASRTLAGTACFTELEREFYLRKAALLDRIALLDAPDSDAEEAASAAAAHLLDMDQIHTDGDVPDHAAMDPCGYVRQEYAHWAGQKRRAELLAAGRCPNCEWPQHDCNCADHPDA